MKLNLNCVRDILLCVEENTGLRKMCVFVDSGLDEAEKFVGNYQEPMEHQKKLLEKHSNDELIYHVNYCVNAELLTISNISTDYLIVIVDLTPKGHDFLGNIRNNRIWGKLQKIFSEAGVKTLEGAIQVAKELGIALLKSYAITNGHLPPI